MKLFKSLFCKNVQKKDFSNFPPIGGVIVSNKIFKNNFKPHFMYRDKRSNTIESGWVIFSGQEDDEYTCDANNFTMLNASSLLELDSSLEKILLKGTGTVWERKSENSPWYQVFDYPLESDYLIIEQINEKWKFEINNLFEKINESSTTVLYSTHDKSIRISLFNGLNKSQVELFNFLKNDIINRDKDTSLSKTIEQFDFSDKCIKRIGYTIKERDEIFNKEYEVLYGFSIIDNEYIVSVFYYDDPNDKQWAINTWQTIELIK